MSDFFQYSKEIANDFLQNIVFIDDEAYSEEKTDHFFNAADITKEFAKSQKICSVYNPKKESEIPDLVNILLKADIVVLDWQMDIKGEKSVGNEEEDEEHDDPRGTHTMKIINDVLFDNRLGNRKNLQLIVVYTGETNLREITSSIYDQLKNQENTELKEFEVLNDSFKIVVNGKTSIPAKHTAEIKARIKDYHELPEYILDEFTKMTSGLVPNVALSAITSIRKNNAKIMHLYNKQLDPAFLAQRALLSVPDDAGELLTDSIINSFEAIIDYDHIEHHCSFDQVKKWIESHEFSEKNIDLNKKKLKISNKELTKWQQKGFSKAIKEIWKKQFSQVVLPFEKVDNKGKYSLHKDVLNYFLPDNFEGDSHNEKFSMLTHHKSNFTNPSYVPKLSLGTIVQGRKTGTYWICIQQKCDCVRIGRDEQRRFLFLPLIADEKKFNILVEDGDTYIKLRIEFDTHKLRTVKFKSNKDGSVCARKFGNKYLFRPLYSKGHPSYNAEIDENILWIMDLQESHAQRVANHYASSLSRVGLDESEWLRRSSN